MSVLVEALSLVIPRNNLDISYPGGVDTFLEAMCAPECPARHVCTDATLVSVSFLTPDEAETVVASLIDLGFLGLDEQRFRDFAFIDQHLGPTMPCEWLEWRRHPDGVTYAWSAGAEPGDMATPRGWTPGHSRGMTRTDLRDEPGRMLKLAEEGDIETWLDFRTGEVTVGMKRLAECATGAQSPPSRENATTEGSLPQRFQGKVREEKEDGLLAIVVSALRERGLRTDRMDGNVRCRCAVDVEDGALTPAMVGNIVAAGAWTLDEYHDALVRVMIDDADPAQGFEDNDE